MKNEMEPGDSRSIQLVQSIESFSLSLLNEFKVDKDLEIQIEQLLRLVAIEKKNQVYIDKRFLGSLYGFMQLLKNEISDLDTSSSSKSKIEDLKKIEYQVSLAFGLLLAGETHDDLVPGRIM